jgi:hypothetical protein
MSTSVQSACVYTQTGLGWCQGHHPLDPKIEVSSASTPSTLHEVLPRSVVQLMAVASFLRRVRSVAIGGTADLTRTSQPR